MCPPLFRSNRKLQLAVGIAAAAAALAGATANAQLLYSDPFARNPADGTGNIGAQNFGWGRYNLNGTLSSQTSGVNGTDAGNPTDAPAVNAGPFYLNADNTTLERGWMFLDGNTAATSGRLAMTTEYSFNPADYSAGVYFSWYQGNDYTAGANPLANDFRLIVRNGGSWYASAATFSNTSVEGGALFGSGSEQQTLIFDPAAANWLTVAFDGDISGSTPVASTVELAVGGVAGADLSGPITGFGLIREVNGANARFDTFQIGVVPEPSSLSLLALGGLGAMLFRRRA